LNFASVEDGWVLSDVNVSEDIFDSVAASTSFWEGDVVEVDCHVLCADIDLRVGEYLCDCSG